MSSVSGLNASPQTAAKALTSIIKVVQATSAVSFQEELKKLIDGYLVEGLALHSVSAINVAPVANGVAFTALVVFEA